MEMLHELKRVKQDVERLESQNELPRRRTEDVLDGIVREGGVSTEVVDQVGRKLKLEYVGHSTIVDQRFKS